VAHVQWGCYSFSFRAKVYDILERSMECESEDRLIRMDGDLGLEINEVG